MNPTDTGETIIVMLDFLVHPVHPDFTIYIKSNESCCTVTRIVNVLLGPKIDKMTMTFCCRNILKTKCLQKNVLDLDV